MSVTKIWRLLLLLTALGVTNMTWGQYNPYQNKSKRYPYTKQADTNNDQENRNTRVTFCENNIIDNGDFESFSDIPLGECNPVLGPPLCSASIILECTTNRSPFHACAIEEYGDWWISHGTPEIKREDSGFTEDALMIWSGQFNAPIGDNTVYGEGLFNNCFTFEEGNTYELSFRAKGGGSSLGNLFIKLANNISGPNDYNNPNLFTVNEYYEIPEAIGQSQTIYSQQGWSETSFTTFNITFVPDQDYSMLWIYPTEPTDDLFILGISDFCVSCVEPESQVIYTESTTLPEATSAYTLINAKEDARVYSGDDVGFYCGTEILLESNFTVEDGAIFKAVIAPVSSCSNFTCASGNTLTDDDESDTREKELEVSIQNKKLEEINIFPNPSTGIINLPFIPSKEVPSISYTLVNTLGEIILKNSTITNSRSLDLSNQPKGIYFIQIQSEKTQVTKRLIIQ